MQQIIARIITSVEPAPLLPNDHIWHHDQLISEANALSTALHELMDVLLYRDYHERTKGNHDAPEWELWLRLSRIHERAAARFIRRLDRKKAARA